jgi:hypothetical protein
MRVKVLSLDDIPDSERQKWTLARAPRIMTKRVFDRVKAQAVLLHPPSHKWGEQAILVLAGSEMMGHTFSSCNAKARRTRSRIVSSGVEDFFGGGWRLRENVRFSTPSTAANVMYGGSKDGWINWCLETDAGSLTLDEAFQLADSGKFELHFYRPPAHFFDAEL